MNTETLQDMINSIVHIDPVIWTAFLKHNIRLKISNE